MALAFLLSGGGGSGKLQSKSATPSASEQIITPDTGYDGLEQVTVAAVATQKKTLTITQNQSMSILPDEGKFINEVDLTVNVPSGGGGITGGYTVTFNADGADYSIVSIKAGNAIKEPIPPELTGKVVAGWSTDADGENLVSFPYTPTANTILYAKLSAASTTLNDNSWATISAISAAGTGANYWSVGDTKTITLSGTVGTLALNSSYKVFIIGFNHNSDKEGTGISFSGFRSLDATNKELCLVDQYYNSYNSTTTSFTMNPGTSSTSTNVGGWKKAKIRKNILGSTDVENGDATSATITSPGANTLMAALPADLRAVLKPITKYTDCVGNKSTAASAILPTVDYLPLMAEFEVFGTRSYANENEKTYQAQYQYYKNGNSKIKYKHSDVSTAAVWWMASIPSPPPWV